jgi:hypothetical protein
MAHPRRLAWITAARQPTRANGGRTPRGTGRRGSGNGPFSAECPSSSSHRRDYYLFRTTLLGTGTDTVYLSNNPLDFGVYNTEGHFVCNRPWPCLRFFSTKASGSCNAPLPSLKGIQITRMEWGATK